MFKFLYEVTEKDKVNVGLKAYNCSRLLGLKVKSKNGFVIYNNLESKDIEYIEKYAKENVLYAVRSSMQNEDGIQTSNAGLYKSMIAVRKKDLVENIKYVFESAINCKQRAVLVQELVVSEAAGVIFTRNPIYNEESMVINACLGAGENVVSSIMEEDKYEISEKGIQAYPAEKRAVFTYGWDCIPGEHIWLNKIETRVVISNEYKTIHSIYYEYTRQCVLCKEQLEELYSIAMYLKTIFKCELDIEFAIEKNSIYVLQVRPITVFNCIKEENKVKEVEEGELKGQIVSQGKFCGEALFIDVAHMSNIIEQEDKFVNKVIVIYELIPEVLHCLDKIGAIVTAKGGVLSHGAIMAREKGIPCISGLGDQIYEIRTGMIVNVNAEKGEILIGTSSINNAGVS